MWCGVAFYGDFIVPREPNNDSDDNDMNKIDTNDGEW